MIDEGLRHEAEALLQACRARGVMLATAESCTGGLIAAALTAIAGSSDVVDRGFVTYSNEAKTQMLDVPPETIAAVGAVSQEVAGLMASGALAHSRAGIAVAVTGVAGPGGGSAEKPVGLVWFGLAERGGASVTERRVFAGDRTAVRAATVAHAFAMIRAALGPSEPAPESPPHAP
jgi:nicotinamide-nucleotide amidase